MTGEELHALGMSVWGHGYQARIAASLEVDVRTVRRWTKGESPVPAGAEDEIRSLVAAEEEVTRLEEEAYAYVAPRVDAILAEAGGHYQPAVLVGVVSRAVERMRDKAGAPAAIEMLRAAMKSLQTEDAA